MEKFLLRRKWSLPPRHKQRSSNWRKKVIEDMTCPHLIMKLSYWKITLKHQKREPFVINEIESKTDEICNFQRRVLFTKSFWLMSAFGKCRRDADVKSKIIVSRRHFFADLVSSTTWKVQTYQNKTGEKFLYPSKYVLTTYFREF